MNSIREFFNKKMLSFIGSFILADIAIMLAQAMTSWFLFEKLGIEYVAIITLFGLLLNTIVNKKFGFIIDKFSRSTSIIFANMVMAVLLSIAIVSQWIWASVAFSVLTSIYFSCFYASRGAMAQVMSIGSQQGEFKKLNAMLVVTDKMGAVLVGAVVASLFAWLGTYYLTILSLLILLISSIWLYRFGDPTLYYLAQRQNQSSKSDSSKKQIQRSKGFAWFFTNKNAFLVTCALSITIVVMIGNTIKSTFLYDVLQLEPDSLAIISIAYNTTAVLGGIMVGWVTNEIKAIHACIAATFIITLLLAFMPNFTMFIIASASFGLLNSINRVLYDSVIMRSIPNQDMGSFYGLLGSINQGVQFLLLFAINIFLWLSKSNISTFDWLKTEWIIWFYPAIFAFLPVCFVSLRNRFIKKHI